MKTEHEVARQLQTSQISFCDLNIHSQLRHRCRDWPLTRPQRNNTLLVGVGFTLQGDGTCLNGSWKSCPAPGSEERSLGASLA